MPGVVELLDRAVELPPGPQLAAVLGEVSWPSVPNTRLVEVLQARSRQLAHEQALLFAGMVEIARAVPVAGLPDEAVARSGEDVEWAAHEIAAGLTWTPTTAERELDLARVLVHELPLVFAALEQGRIDRGKAKVFADHLDPGRGELTRTQIRKLCERFVPLAPGWTARRLARRLLAAIQAIDPQFHRRRYRRGLRERGVVLHLNRDGTATLSGEGLPPDEAAAAAARLDRLAEAARRAGHPGRLGQICADLYLGMLDGSFHGLSETQILARLLAQPRPEDTDPADAGDTDAVGAGAGGADGAGDAAVSDSAASAAAGADPTRADPADTCPTPDAPAGDGSAGGGPAGGGPAGGGPAGGGPGWSEADRPGLSRPERVSAAESGGGIGDVARTGAAADPPRTHPTGAPAGAGSPDPGPDRWRREQIGVREGIELRVGLATLLGCDQRPAEIPGLGPIDAEIARTVVARQRRGARWQFAIVDPQGYLLLAGPLRRRPRTTDPPRESGRVRGGVVELHLTLDELSRFAADPDRTGGWAGVVAEIAGRWADRHRLWQELDKHPRARYARGALARHAQVRDRTCVGPGCERSARRSDLDHTLDHHRGGRTVETNIGPGCRRHHRDKDRGWRLFQPQPGHFVWISPLGRTYRTRGGPVRPDLPDPDPPPEGTDPRHDPDTETGQPLDLRILWREAHDPAPPPPPPDDEEEPPF